MNFGKYFWKLGKCRWGGNAWVRFGVYLVYLEFF
jgi:hypothetical protein